MVYRFCVASEGYNEADLDAYDDAERSLAYAARMAIAAGQLSAASLLSKHRAADETIFPPYGNCHQIGRAHV